MKKLNLICLFVAIFVAFIMIDNSIANYSTYTSIHQNINYKQYLDSATLLKSQNTFPSVGATSSPVFKAFFPGGATMLSLPMNFFGWDSQRCYTGVIIKYWIGDEQEPQQKGVLPNDLWSGKYMEQIAYAEAQTFAVISKDFQPSEEAVWVYFTMDITCPAAFIQIGSSYKLDLEKYSEWYKYVTDNSLWGANGEPPGAITITLSTSSESVNEGDEIVYTAQLSEPSPADISIPYTISGSNTLNQDDYECSVTEQASGSRSTCPTKDNPTTGVIAINKGEDTGTLKLKLKQDNITETDEILTINFGPSGKDGGYAHIVNPAVSITIKDAVVEEPKDVKIVPGKIEIVSNDSPEPGGTITISDSNKNEGADNSGQFTISYYLVKHSDKEGGTIKIDNISQLGKLLYKKEIRITANNTANETSLQITFPDSKNTEGWENFFDDDLKPWIVKVISLNNELPDSDKFARFEQDFKLPDLYVEKIEVGKNPVPFGEPLNITATIGNKGTSPAKEVKVAFYIVTDTTDIKDLFKEKNSSGSFFAQIPSGLTPIYSDQIISVVDSTTPQKISTTIKLPENTTSTFRVLAMVNDNFMIPESNSFNNFVKKDFTAEEKDKATWEDENISAGASEQITIIPENANLVFTDAINFYSKLDGQNAEPKFKAGDAITIRYQLKNDGAIFDANDSPETFISIYLSKDKTFDAEDKTLKDNIKIDQNIGAGDFYPADGMGDINFILDSSYLPGKYYILVILHSGEQTKKQKELEMDILKVFTPTSELVMILSNSDAPVYLGDMVKGGSNGILHSQLKIQFPAYSEYAVTHYAAFVTPDGSIFFIQNKNTQDITDSLTNDYVPYIKNTKDSVIQDIFEEREVDIYNNLNDASMKGRWSVFWLTAIYKENDTLDDILNRGVYELGGYTFDIPFKSETK